MKLTISDGKEYISKKTNNKSIVFHLRITECEGVELTIKGFRYLNKCIAPPSIRIKTGYTQTVYISEPLYKGIYDLVSQQEWGKDILPCEEAFMGEFLNSKTMSLGGFGE